jgi:hypothetical protein
LDFKVAKNPVMPVTAIRGRKESKEQKNVAHGYAVLAKMSLGDASLTEGAVPSFEDWVRGTAWRSAMTTHRVAVLEARAPSRRCPHRAVDKYRVSPLAESAPSAPRARDRHVEGSGLCENLLPGGRA